MAAFKSTNDHLYHFAVLIIIIIIIIIIIFFNDELSNATHNSNENHVQI